MQPSTMRRLLAPLTVIGVLAGSGLVPAASANIVVGQSLAGVKLGDSETQVMQTLGPPTFRPPPAPTGSVQWNYGKPPLVGALGFTNGKLSSMWTSSKRQKTNKGVGPDSSFAQVRNAYPKAKCSTGPFGPKSVICALKSKASGRAVETMFVFFTRSLPAREVDIDFV